MKICDKKDQNETSRPRLKIFIRNLPEKPQKKFDDMGVDQFVTLACTPRDGNIMKIQRPKHRKSLLQKDQN